MLPKAGHISKQLIWKLSCLFTLIYTAVVMKIFKTITDTKMCSLLQPYTSVCIEWTQEDNMRGCVRKMSILKKTHALKQK